MMTPKIICLTPVRNEEWILERFLNATSLWADHIILADQNSSDRSREIAETFEKVTLVSNPSAVFNESERQKLLIDEARKIPGKRVLIALDADEFLSGNFVESREWEHIKTLAEGTVINFRWANIRPNLRQYWTSDYFPWGFVDDGTPHSGRYIHSPRIPIPEKPTAVQVLQDIFVMHFQYTDWERMLSKQRWYQCLERVRDPNRSAWSIYRQYHHMDGIGINRLLPLQDAWFEAYESRGIGLRNMQKEKSYWWDDEVLSLMKERGAAFFMREDIWDVAWTEKAQEKGLRSEDFGDPRSRYEKVLNRIFRTCQPFFNSSVFGSLKQNLESVRWRRKRSQS